MGSVPFDYASYFSAPPYPYSPNPATAFSYQPDWSTNDPGFAAKQNRGFMGAWGQNMDTQLAQQAQYAQQLENWYRSPMNAAAGQLAQTPGYTDQELQNILQTGAYQQGMTTPGEYAALNPTDQESAAMLGDPNSLYNYFSPDYLQGLNTQAANAQRGLYSDATGRMTAALNTQQGAGHDIIANQQQQLSDPYLNSLVSAYQGHEGTINNAVNSQGLKLNLDPNSYLMSDQELQSTMNQAGEAVQASSQARMDQIRRAAAASGNSDAMALAALDFQSGRQADEAKANAQTNAYLAAKGQQRDLAMNYAQANLGANQTQAGMNVGAQQNLLAQQLGAAQGYEGMQLGLTQQQLSQANLEAANQLQAGQYLGSTGLGMEQGIGNQAQNTQQFITGTGTNIAGNVNQLNTNYANQQYQNRLQNAMYGQQNRFNQNTGITDRQAAAYQSGANARMGGQNQFLNWATGQVGQAVGQGQTAQQQRIGAAQATFNPMNQATGQWGSYNQWKSQQPTAWDKAISAGVGAAGAFFGGV